MAYNPTTWKDQVLTDPTKYKIIKESGTEEVVNIERVPGEIIQEGTSVTADKLNNIEQGIRRIDDELTKPLYQTIKSDDANIISLPASAEGQVNIGLKARTYTNLFGSDGDCEELGTVIGANGIASLDTTTKVFGSSSIKVTSNVSATVAVKINKPSNLDESKYYLFSAFVKNTNWNSYYAYTYGSAKVGVSYGEQNMTTFKRIGIALTPSEILNTTAFAVYGGAEIDSYLNVDGLMLNEITAEEYNNLTVDQLLGKYLYINSTKSTVLAQRFKSIGKNLVKNGNCENGTNEWGNDYSVNPPDKFDLQNNEFHIINGGKYTQPIKVKSNTNYTIKVRGKTIGGTGSVYWADKSKTIQTSLILNTIYEYRTLTFNTGDNDTIYILSYTNGEMVFNELSLVEGSDALESYESYNESISYMICKDENESIMEMHSLPNGVEGEVTKAGKLIKRTNKSILDGNLDWSFVADYSGYKRVSIPVVDGVNDAGYVWDNSNLKLDNEFSTWSTNPRGCRLIGGVLNIHIPDIESGWGETYTPSSTDIKNYFTSKPYTLIYKLAQPKAHDLNVTPLTAYLNGTIIVEKVIPQVSLYNSTNGCQVLHSQYPIERIDFIRKVNQADGSYLELDVSKAVITGDKQSFAHPDLSDGDLVDWDYYYPEELGIYPSSEVTVTANHKGQTNSNTESIRQLSEVTQNIDDRVKANQTLMADLETNQGDLSTLATTSKDSLVSAMNEVFTNVSNGKSLIATAVTDKGVATSSSDTFQTMANSINNLFSNPLKSIQRGSGFINRGVTYDITINPVDMENSIVMVNSSANNDGSYSGRFRATGYLKNDTTLSLDSEYGSVYAYYAWQVIEFNPEVISRIQHVNMTIARHVDTITIQPVDPSKTILIVGYSGTDDVYSESHALRLFLQDNQTLDYSKRNNNSRMLLSSYIVEFK